MEVCVAIEGFTLPSRYVLKELALIFSKEEYDHFMFMRPTDFILTEADKRTVRYITYKLNNISYDDGDIPYNQIQNILRKLRQYTIYTYSDIAKKFLQECLPTTVIINTQELGLQLQKSLPNPQCFRHHNHRYCAKAKAIAVMKFIENEHI